MDSDSTYSNPQSKNNHDSDQLSDETYNDKDEDSDYENSSLVVCDLRTSKYGPSFNLNGIPSHMMECTKTDCCRVLCHQPYLY